MPAIKYLLKDLEKNEKFIIGKIKSGKFKNELEDTYNMFLLPSEYNKVKFELFLTLRKKTNLVNIPLLSKVLNLPEYTVYQIFNNPYKISYFPVVYTNGNKATLEKILTVELKDDVLITFEEDKEKTDAISFIKEKVDKNFFVLFSSNFKHTSFMLSLYANLKYEKEILEKYAFTGIIGNDGYIYEVEAVEEKNAICEEEGKILIHPQIVSTLSELDYWLNKPYIHIPFLQLSTKDLNKAFKDLESSIKENNPDFSIETLKYLYQFTEEDLSLYSSEHLPVDEEYWTNYINKEFETKIKNILNKTSNKTPIFDISTSVSALSFGLGIKLGSRINCNIYHLQPGQEKKYFKVISMETSKDLRKLKEKNFENFKYFQIEIEKKSNFSEVALAFYISSHNPFADTKRFLRKNNMDIPLIKISNKPPLPIGNLPIDTNWVDYVIELDSIIEKLREKYQIEKFHFFMSVPNALSFALGMAIGHILDIDVYHKVEDKDIYRKVFNTHNIKSPF